MAGSINFSKIIRSVGDIRRDTGTMPSVCVVGGDDELRRVVSILSAQAVDELGGVSGVIDALAPADFPRDPRTAGRWDAVVLIAAGTPAADLLPVVDAVHHAGRHVIGVVEREVADGDAWAYDAGLRPEEIAHGIAGSGTPSLENRLVHALHHRMAPLAARLPALRRAYCDHVVLTAAAQNAAVGAAFFFPGADMPAMTLNQVRMVLRIAHAYGEELGFGDRALEILSVIGIGYVFRALARQALDFVPGFGWALKGAVGFSGTVALGQAAVAYFEAGAPLRLSRMQRISSRLDQVRSRLPDALQRGLAGG